MSIIEDDPGGIGSHGGEGQPPNPGTPAASVKAPEVFTNAEREEMAAETQHPGAPIIHITQDAIPQPSAIEVIERKEESLRTYHDRRKAEGASEDELAAIVAEMQAVDSPLKEIAE